MDESGEHDAEGTLRRFTIGCAVATAEQWARLQEEWEPTLRAYGVEDFHMKNFEARKGIYKDWTNEKRQAFLASLLAVISNYVPVFVGCNQLPRDIGPGRGPLRQAYFLNLLKILTEFDRAHSDLLQGEPVTLVLAKHGDISPIALQDWFAIFEQRVARHPIAFGGVDDPKRVPALQVADIVAYEFSRTSRAVRPEDERYPLVTLAAKARRFTLLDATFLYERDDWSSGKAEPFRWL